MITPALLELRLAFWRHDRTIRLVGGAVRAMLLGEEPSDIDLCTDANPDEQRAIYEAENIRHFPTGIQHGTWTVLLSDHTVVEITSLHDGTMAWTGDWILDLSRRDLTINAMAMSLDGKIIDPFGGRADLEQRVVRFVADAATRIQEDHLRILRFFRFHSRIAGQREYDRATMAAIDAHKAGLQDIARERVWSEISRIIVGPFGVKTLYDIIGCGIATYIDLPEVPGRWLHPEREFQVAQEPASLLAAYLGDREMVRTQASLWKWSTQERQDAEFVIALLTNCPDLSLPECQRLAARGMFKHWLAEALRLLDKPDDAQALIEWPVPFFPISGKDVLQRGVSEGPDVGRTLKDLREVWYASEYRMSREALLERINP